jgi:hypothetical protein
LWVLCYRGRTLAWTSVIIGRSIWADTERAPLIRRANWRTAPQPGDRLGCEDVRPCLHVIGQRQTFGVLTPTTDPGRWSILATGVFVVLVSTFALLVATGQRGGEDFFDNLWLTIPFLAAYIASVVAFAFGAVAIASAGERSVTVIGVTILGLLITSFGVLEVLFPH